MASTPVVMISSTARELPEHRKQVIDACLRLGMFPRSMEHLPASDSDAVRISVGMVDEAEIYQGLFAHRYGYVPAGSEVSLTEMEYDRAVERGIPRLIYLMHEDHPVRAADVEKGPAAVKLEALKARLAAEHVIAYFKSHARLVYSRLRQPPKAQEVQKAIAWIRRHGGQCNPTDLAKNNVAGVQKKTEAEALMKELEDLAKPDRQAAGRAVFNNDFPVNRTREIVGPVPAPLQWIPRGRDSKLEQIILQRIRDGLFL